MSWGNLARRNAVMDLTGFSLSTPLIKVSKMVCFFPDSCQLFVKKYFFSWSQTAKLILHLNRAVHTAVAQLKLLLGNSGRGH